MLKAIPGLIGTGGYYSATSTLLNGLQAYYKLEDVNDSSGNALNLTNHGTATFISGKVNNCGHFVAASSQYLEHAADSHYQVGASTDFSMCAWFKAATGDANRRIIATHGTPSAGGLYGFWRWDENLQIHIYDGTNELRLEKAGVFDSNWHLVVATWNRTGNCTPYVDNVQTPAAASITSVGDVGSHQFNIGFIVDSYYNGDIDEVGLWNRVLTSTEIGNLWNGGAGTTYPFTGL